MHGCNIENDASSGFLLRLVDDLAHLPLPLEIGRYIGASKHDEPSAHDLLCAVVGSPSLLDSPSPSDGNLVKRTAAITVFAAVQICEAATPVLRVGFPFRDGLADASLSDATRIGLTWLGQQFPSRVFPKAIEDLIEKTSILKYA